MGERGRVPVPVDASDAKPAAEDQAAGKLGRSEHVLALQRKVGNAAVVRLLSGRKLQRQDHDEAARVAKLKADYRQALADGDWGQAALLLNAFNDTDIPKLLPRDIAALGWLRDAALRAMPGWSGRVTAAIDALLHDPWPLMPADDRVLYVMNLLVGTYHYPENGAAGIVGNLWGESGVLPSRVEGRTRPRRRGLETRRGR